MKPSQVKLSEFYGGSMSKDYLLLKTPESPIFFITDFEHNKLGEIVGDIAQMDRESVVELKWYEQPTVSDESQSGGSGGGDSVQG